MKIVSNCLVACIKNMRLFIESKPYELPLESLHSQRSIGVWCHSLFSRGRKWQCRYCDNWPICAYGEWVPVPRITPSWYLPYHDFVLKNGGTAHAARQLMNTLSAVREHRTISHYGDILLPARSPDLSACDFFLWGYLKSIDFRQN